jgi:oxygen-independent coproporphyrinogen III oxidase
MTVNLAERYDMRVPRYTSYPTAPHFTEAVGSDRYVEWLGELKPGQDVSLYFHIPFCDTLCWFCGCHTKIVRNYKPVTEYIKVISKEISLISSRVSGRVKASHIHWGGGSPTILTGDDWRQIMDWIGKHFDIASDAEIAVEMDPRDTTEEYVKALAGAGVNRASIGVQDFDPEVQKAVNRIQSFETTERVVGWLRDHGITGLNMDLMYGLPHQTTERVVSTVDQAVTLAPQRIALFGYAHVPWMKAHQKLIDADTLPDTAARWDQAQAAANRLVEAGYEAIGLDHFARSDDSLAKARRDGRLHRNFQGYTVDEAPVLLGFGASAIGSLPQGYV